METKGIKQDLINRLQAYLEEHAEEEANEEDVLGDETEEEEPKPLELPVKEEEPPEKTVDVAAEKKVVKITSEIPQTEVGHCFRRAVYIYLFLTLYSICVITLKYLLIGRKSVSTD